MQGGKLGEGDLVKRKGQKCIIFFQILKLNQKTTQVCYTSLHPRRQPHMQISHRCLKFLNVLSNPIFKELCQGGYTNFPHFELYSKHFVFIHLICFYILFSVVLSVTTHQLRSLILSVEYQICYSLHCIIPLVCQKVLAPFIRTYSYVDTQRTWQNPSRLLPRDYPDTQETWRIYQDF